MRLLRLNADSAGGYGESFEKTSLCVPLCLCELCGFVRGHASSCRRTVENATGARRCHFAVFKDHLAVDEDDGDAFGIAVRLFEGCCVAHTSRVEHRDVGLEALAQHPAIGETKPLRRQ